MKTLSVIVPIYNEGTAFSSFLNNLYREVSKLGLKFEILVLDSVTKDNSKDVVIEFSKKHKEVKGYFLRHPGVAVTDKTNKYMLGFELAQGDYVVTMDGDGQDRPEEMFKFIEKLEDGYDFVIGYKQKRKDGRLYILTSKVANGLMRWVTGVKVHDMNNGYKAFRKEILGDLKLRSGHFRFLPVIASAKKWKTDEVRVLHKPRESGRGKFSFISRLQGGLFDMVIVFIVSKMGDTPMYLLGWTALAIFLFSVILLGIALFTEATLVGVFSALFFGLSMQLLLIGVIIEYIRGEQTTKSYRNLIVSETN